MTAAKFNVRWVPDLLVIIISAVLLNGENQISAWNMSIQNKRRHADFFVIISAVFVSPQRSESNLASGSFFENPSYGIHMSPKYECTCEGLATTHSNTSSWRREKIDENRAKLGRQVLP
jgi:hypothetical protein